MAYEAQRPPYTISTDPSRLDLDVIHDFLANEAYWSLGVAREVVVRALKHALCFGVYQGEAQVGLARVITDYATFAHIADVFILKAHRGRGLGKWLVETMLAHPALQGLRKWTLDTRDAHGLYAQFGFVEAPAGIHMVYRLAQQTAPELVPEAAQQAAAQQAAAQQAAAQQATAQQVGNTE